jgi:hypothetical protein
VVAERISHAVETHGLLPTSHFGARKQRSAEQALVLLQEQIYTAWRGRRVLSLISFDVKGAYSGVCKERLLQRMKARGIPVDLLRWVEAFCSNERRPFKSMGKCRRPRAFHRLAYLRARPCPRSYSSSSMQTSYRDRSTARAERWRSWMILPHG